MDGKRYLIVTADDFGIGPATSEGILELAGRGVITGTVLLVNSPYAESAVRAWRQTGAALELGWHPCLTLDRPILPAEKVPSLVDADGRFYRLGRLLRRLCLGQVRGEHIRAEFRAQYGRFHDLVGRPPSVVNSHHHIQVFAPIGRILCEVLSRQQPRPYLRHVREPLGVIARVPGARFKRLSLSLLGRGGARRQQRGGFAGNQWLAGITDPPFVADPAFLKRWLTHVPGRVVELTCHPGYLDAKLIGRDCTPGDGQLQRRVHEFHLLRHSSFQEACRRAGFTLIAPRQLREIDEGRQKSAA